MRARRLIACVVLGSVGGESWCCGGVDCSEVAVEGGGETSVDDPSVGESSDPCCAWPRALRRICCRSFLAAAFAFPSALGAMIKQQWFLVK